MRVGDTLQRSLFSSTVDLEVILRLHRGGFRVAHCVQQGELFPPISFTSTAHLLYVSLLLGNRRGLPADHKIWPSALSTCISAEYLRRGRPYPQRISRQAPTLLGLSFLPTKSGIAQACVSRSTLYWAIFRLLIKINTFSRCPRTNRYVTWTLSLYIYSQTILLLLTN